MTRLMSWNIQDLGINKLLPAPGVDAHQQRFVHIINTIGHINPDILVVVEIETSAPLPGYGQNFLIGDTSGGPAVRMILAQLQVLDPGADWRLVPPIVTGVLGQKEGVAVFFKNANVNFRGPNQLDHYTHTYSNGTQVTLHMSGGVTSGVNPTYPAPWNTVLPATPPAGGPFPPNPPGVAKNQDQLAGQAFFWDHAGRQINFPYIGNRAPFLTVFKEVAAPQRELSVFACHLPPRHQIAAQAVSSIMRIPQVIDTLALNKVRVICGDFNINLRDPAQTGEWAPITTTPIPLAGGGNAFFQLQHHRNPTEYKLVPHASLYGFPPRYDVLSTGYDLYTQTYNHPGMLRTVDAIFAVANGAPALVGAAAGRVVNRVVDTPYGAAAPTIPQAMAMTAPALIALGGAMRDPAFRQMPNFGKIHGASDHLPVYADL